jgi:hypothetical protein
MYTSFKFISPETGRVHTLHVHTSVENDDTNQTYVRIGFPTQQRTLAMTCVFFIVPHDPTEPIDLQWVGFKPTCASPDINNGVMLMKAAIHYIFEMFPNHAEGIQLTDDSKLTMCKTGVSGRTYAAHNARDIAVSLAYHNILLYGQTWYQRHFGAYVVSHKPEIKNENTSKLDEIRRILKSQKQKTDFGEWFDTYVLSMTNGRRGFDWASCDAMRTALESIYTKTDTWMDFFQAVNTECGCGIFFVLIETVLRNSPSQGGFGLNMGTWTFQIPAQQSKHIINQIGTGGFEEKNNSAAAKSYFYRTKSRIYNLPVEL